MKLFNDPWGPGFGKGRTLFALYFASIIAFRYRSILSFTCFS